MGEGEYLNKNFEKFSVKFKFFNYLNTSLSPTFPHATKNSLFKRKPFSLNSRKN